VWGSPSGLEPAYRASLLGSHRLAVFRNFRNCVSAVARYLRYYEYLAAYDSPFDSPATQETAAAQYARSLLRAHGSLTEAQAKSLLAIYGVPISRDQVVATEDEAVVAAEQLGYPVVLKGLTPHVAHKSEHGLVRVGLHDGDAVRIAYRAVHAAAARLSKPLDALLVSEQIDGGIETILGLVNDDVFGPTVMFGMGGVTAEVVRDISYRVPPFTRKEAARMVDELRAAPLFHGFRGRPAADLDAVVDAIMSFQAMAVDLSLELREVETNPLFVLPSGVVAADALVVRR
jgi:acyl-CoA synthetase (NDP forming)